MINIIAPVLRAAVKAGLVHRPRRRWRTSGPCCGENAVFHRIEEHVAAFADYMPSVICLAWTCVIDVDDNRPGRSTNESEAQSRA